MPDPGVFQSRIIDSPLAAVMNTGFVIGGFGILVGMVCVATTLTGRIRILTVVLGTVTGIGHTLVGIMHTSTEAARDGTFVLHFTGAARVVAVTCSASGASPGRSQPYRQASGCAAGDLFPLSMRQMTFA